MSGIMVMSCAPQQKKLVYPETAKVDTVDVYFGTQVPDPYRSERLPSDRDSREYAG